MAINRIPTVQEIFPIVGKPTVTYVAQDSGSVEKKLRDAVQSRGQLCLLTGPSKLGKTTLYRRVLSELKIQPIVIRCTEGMTVRSFWVSALEDLNFEQLAERVKSLGSSLSADIGVSGEFGWGWLAKVVPSVKVSATDKSESSIKSAFVKADLSAKHLIPALNELPVLLVVEDFHYLSEAVKKEIFQQWKSFVDEEVSVLIVSTSHHASDIARSNPDLRGRTRHVELEKWNTDDLALIPKRGFDILSIKNSASLRNSIAIEACGLPIVAQQICQTFALSLDLSPSSIDRRKDFQPSNLQDTYSRVLSDFYSDYDRDYERLLAGPRSGSRKYDTYSAILGAFALEPLEFSLREHVLIDRINEISSADRIPLASINSSLNALGSHQKRMGTTLLEWQPHQDMLHIVEPTFLFFLRQKLKAARGTSSKSSDINTLLKELMIRVRGFEGSQSRLQLLESPNEQGSFFGGSATDTKSDA
ncbi:AAA family ATPase [Sphingomonas faeni]|uniref:AAA family ATPase n=1 Tax=Sphingomonas faeni TaxID=185950 RepID=UPI0020C17F93|nr:AAA family ATPase [Sphingomonas faeni]MCK8457375.1 AAA family ATPase [Sphingomonas faeni]